MSKSLTQKPQAEACGHGCAPPVAPSLSLRQASRTDSQRANALRARIVELVQEYHAAAFPARGFFPGVSPVPCAGKVFDADEMVCLVESGLDFWLTTGRFAAEFEASFARLFGVRHALLTNSGSSANLLALSCLTSPALGERQLRPGDEVITVATGFPTTVNPIFQNGLVPVFVDVQVGTWNIDVTQLEAARSERTRAVMLAHTLGNPFDLEAVTAFARQHNLFLIEDCCDAVGATYQARPVGGFGDLATVSFYPAHHITMGEGGCVLTDRPALKKLVESFRDWGRDCWCDPGCDNTCGRRFDCQLGELPAGYDHKYTYSHIGYNLKLTDMQAAIGVAQLKKLPDFLAARQRNFDRLYERLSELEEYFVLPRATRHAEPSWFGFPLAVRPGAPFTRNQLIAHLERRKVATRLLFGGNLTRQPAYRGANYRAVGSLANADFAMNQAFWVGIYPGLSDEAIDYTGDVFYALARNPDL
jgi:CDP-6-deoxy-D-xylo-4-hexulose-3-dehydrase